MKCKVLAMILLSLTIFSGCGGHTKTLYSSDAVEVMEIGRRTVVCDLVNSEEYN